MSPRTWRPSPSGGLRYEILRIGFAAIDRLAPDFRHLGHVSRAALTAFDFHRGDIGGHQFRQQFQGVEAGGLLQRVIALAINQVAAFAQRRITGIFAILITVNQHFIETRFQPLRRLLPAYEAGRRTGADGVGRFAGQVGREIAAAFRHDAQAAEGEDFQRHRRGAGQLFHLMNRQHARQYDARDVEVAMIEANGLFIGGGSLHRNVTLNVWVTPAAYSSMAISARMSASAPS